VHRKATVSSMICILLVSSFSMLMLTLKPAVVSAAVLDSAFVRTEIPDEMLAGHVYPVAIATQNLGTTAWTEAAGIRLGALASNQLQWSQWKDGGYSNSVSDSRALIPGYMNVAAGDGAPFNFSIAAPTTPGDYTFGAQMIQDGYAFFGQQYTKTIAVRNVVVDGLPKRLKANGTYRVTVSVLNKGASTWNSAGDYKLTRLDSNFVWSDWANGGTSTTANLAASDTIAANEGTSFSFTITAPATAGTYTFSAQVKSGSTGYSDTYTKSIPVDSSSGIASYEGESFFDVRTGTKATDTASGGSYAYTQGAGNTALWKTGSDYTSYVSTAGEYNVFLRVNSQIASSLRIQMYGGPSSDIYADFPITAINTWQWIGPLTVSFQPGYTDYQLTLWKLGGTSDQFAGVDQVFIVPTDTDNAYAKRLQIDEKTLSYIVPQTTETGIDVNANTGFPVFYKTVGVGDSVIQLTNKPTNDNYATLRDSTVPGVFRIKIEYLGEPASGYAKFRFTNLSAAAEGKNADTILKADGFGRIVFDHFNFFNPAFLDSDLMPGQSVEKTFRSAWLTDGSGNYVVKVLQFNDTVSTIGTFTVAPSNVNASTVITNNTLKTRLEGETQIGTRTGTGTDSLASNGSYAYVSGATGSISLNTGYQSYSYFVNASGTYYVYARVRASNHSAMVRMELYGSDGSHPVYDEHLTGSDTDWKTIGPLKVTIDASKTYNLAFWRIDGESGDSLKVDYVELFRDDYHAILPRVGNYPSVGADDAYNRNPSGIQSSWKVIEAPQPPKQTSLYVKLLDSRQMAVNKETLNVTLGSNMTTTKGATVNDWTIGGKRVLMTWYYPYREADVEPDWQAKVTADLQNIAATGYNVVLLQLFPQFVYPGSAIDYALTECRRLGIKVLPSIYYINQAPWLSTNTGIPIRTSGIFADASDPQFSVAMADWFDQLHTSYGDVFYTNANGQTPIMYGEEHGYGIPQGTPYASRMAPSTIESMRQFRDWLADKYGTVSAMNAAWEFGSSYPAFGTDDTFPNAMLNDIVTNVISKSPKDYPAKWAEGGTALADFDAFRSYSIKVRWLDTRSKILAAHPSILFGAYTFGIFGKEDHLGSTYNYTSYRSGVLADDLEQYTDFVSAAYYTPKQIESATAFWHGKNIDLIPFVPEYGEVSEIFGSSPQRLSDGAYSDIPGLSGIVYTNRYPIYPALKQAVKSGAIPAVYAWNDYPLWVSNTADVRQDIELFVTNVINAP